MNRYVLVLSVICGLLCPWFYDVAKGSSASAAYIAGDLRKDASPLPDRKVTLAQPGEVTRTTKTAADGSYRFYNIVLGKTFVATIVGSINVPARTTSHLNGSIYLSTRPLANRQVKAILPSGTITTNTDANGAFSVAVTNATGRSVKNTFTLTITAASPVCVTTANCNDSNPCTTDTCTSSSRCTYTNNTNTCDDGKFCTVGDTCSGGKCVGAAARNCGDATDCTADTCNETADTCDNLCTASSIEDACCDDPQCDGAPNCAFPGGTFLFRIGSITQADSSDPSDPSCLIGQNLLNSLLALLESLGLNSFEISIPPTTSTPVWVTIPLPLLGNIDVAAAFTGRSLMIIPGQSATADLGEAGGGLLGLNCQITGEPSGGLFWDTPALYAQIDLSQMTVAPGSGAGACTLSTPAPTCTMSFAIEQIP